MNYFESSKNLFNSILFISPFIIIYEFIAFYKFKDLSYQIRNTADIIIRDFISVFSSNVMIVYSIILLLSLITYITINYNMIKIYKFNLFHTFLMYLEGFFFGMFLVLLLNGFDVFSNTSISLENDYILSFYYCVGASIWEEVLFRLICISSMICFFRKIIISKLLSLVISIIFSSILFSAFHYIGSFADTFNIYTFFYRFVGGVYLSILYYYRGIGISMMCHFIYDFILVTIPNF